MGDNDKGQIIVPTGGGKTMIMIQNAIKHFEESPVPQTIVVVAPRILLAQQLCTEFTSLIDADVLHVHSGKNEYKNTTDPKVIQEWVDNNTNNILIFTTYHSLHKVCVLDDVDIVYYDEAHNSTTKSFFPAVQEFSQRELTKDYYFTATPKYGTRSNFIGMNIPSIYGEVIENVTASELIDNGSIIPPTIVPFDVNGTRTRQNAHEFDVDATLDLLDEIDDNELTPKVVVSIGSSKVLQSMLGRTPLLQELKDRGYDILHVTSKFGAYVNDKKVSRTQFMTTLNEWGTDDDKKFIVFHYSILSEGISVSGLTHSIMLRQLNLIEMAQTIGRVIRMDARDKADISSNNIKSGQVQFYRKSTGYVCVPMSSKATLARLQRVVDDIFVKGIPPLPLSYK